MEAGDTVITEQEVRAALNEVVDPCSVAAGAAAGLDEMGLVRAVEISRRPGGAHAHVKICLTDPTCVMAPAFLKSARERLGGLPGLAGYDVELVPTDWTERDMSPGYRRRLAEVRARRARPTRARDRRPRGEREQSNSE